MHVADTDSNPCGPLIRFLTGIDRKHLLFAAVLTAFLFTCLAALSWRNQAATYVYGLEHGFTAHGTYGAASPEDDSRTFVVDAVGPSATASWTLYQGKSRIASGTMESTANPNYYRLVNEAVQSVGTFSIVEGTGVSRGRAYVDHDGSVVEYVKKDTAALHVDSADV